MKLLQKIILPTLLLLWGLFAVSTPSLVLADEATPSAQEVIADPTVVLNQPYVAPQNPSVKVVFTSLPVNPGTINFSSVTLTDSEKSTLGALSNSAFDISSSMTNGTFTYDLTLPKPTGVSVSSLVVKYGSSLSSIDGVINQGISDNGDGTITIHNINHFTVFVVSGVDNSGSCTGATVTPPGGTSTCFTTIQGAIDDPTTVNGVTINISSGTYNENVKVTKGICQVPHSSDSLSQ